MPDIIGWPGGFCSHLCTLGEVIEKRQRGFSNHVEIFFLLVTNFLIKSLVTRWWYCSASPLSGLVEFIELRNRENSISFSLTIYIILYYYNPLPLSAALFTMSVLVERDFRASLSCEDKLSHVLVVFWRPQNLLPTIESAQLQGPYGGRERNQI